MPLMIYVNGTKSHSKSTIKVDQMYCYIYHKFSDVIIIFKTLSFNAFELLENTFISPWLSVSICLMNIYYQSAYIDMLPDFKSLFSENVLKNKITN